MLTASDGFATRMRVPRDPADDYTEAAAAHHAPRCRIDLQIKAPRFSLADGRAKPASRPETLPKGSDPTRVLSAPSSRPLLYRTLWKWAR
jgi:hypothetical protein